MITKLPPIKVKNGKIVLKGFPNRLETRLEKDCLMIKKLSSILKQTLSTIKMWETVKNEGKPEESWMNIN